MRILICHNDYQTFGGESQYVAEEAKSLRGRGHEVSLLGADNSILAGYNFLQKVLFFPRTIFNYRTYRTTIKMVKEFRPDVAQVHNVFPLLSPSVYWALFRSGIPIVQTLHNFRFVCPNGLFFTRGAVCERCKLGNYWSAIRLKCYRESYSLSALYAFTIWLHRGLGVLNRITAFLTLSNFTRQKYIEAGVPDSKLYVRVQEFPPRSVEGGTQGEYALYIGRLSPEKGVETLVDAFLMDSSVKLKIAGNGPLFEILRTRVTAANAVNIEFLGFVNGNEKETVIRRARFLIVPSECYETLGLSVVEAYSYGKPVLAARIGALKEIVKEGVTGRFFQSGSKSDLLQKARLLFKDQIDPRRLRQYLLETPGSSMDVSIRVRQLDQLYDSLLHSERKP